ncbi:stage II sporulation protein M [Candidatus Pacearchaeota archaeon]|nr:stage II sporulation protein M [Candidatus Pacearchaeota archaeon]
MEKKRAKEFSIKEEYGKSWQYIKKSKKFIYSVVIIFFIFSIVGFFIPAPEFIGEEILRFIQGLIEKTSNMSAFELIKFLFVNNLQSGFYGLFFGVVLGIFPLIAAVANGYMLGFVASMSVQSTGTFVLWRLLPHGIFELPAIFISLGLGLKLGMFIFHKKKSLVFREYFTNSLRVFLLVVVPLLLIAGIIEGILFFVLR